MFMSSVSTALLAIAAVLAPAQGAPTASSLQQSNALAAQKLNAQFASLKLTDACNAGDQACINGSVALCSNGNWTAEPCAAGEMCVALPLVNAEGTTVTCDTQADALGRMQDAGVDASLTGNNTVASGSPEPSTIAASTSLATGSATGSASVATSAEVPSDTPVSSVMSGSAVATPTDVPPAATSVAATSDPAASDPAPATSAAATSDAVTSAAATSDAATSAAVTSSALSSSAPSATSTSSTDGEGGGDDGGDDDCTDDGADPSMPVTSDAAPTQASGDMRKRFFNPAVWAEVSPPPGGVFTSASTPDATSVPAVSAPAGSSIASAETTSAPLPTGTAASTADPADDSVLVITIATTMYMTVTVPAAAATSSTPASIFPTPSASDGFPTSAGFPTASSVAGSAGAPSAFPSSGSVPSLVTPSALSSALPSGSVGASSASIAFSEPGTGASSVPTTTALSDNTGTFDGPSFTGAVSSTLPIVSGSPGARATPTGGNSASAASLTSASSSLRFTVVTTLGSPTPTPEPVTTYDSSDLAFLLTATVTP
ncbi:hypothetical protein PsYK624_095290 [Phanerochaete sordida]|uniref:Carbohydrate-binding module family 19 domain-containing protein n=1 Tax=Phanerochaete sordida TaxID=48140 RepID=A0A9P3LFJ8_9APHY|nr:hypothetical protein PsYK624_095290 [Phanerochaete sordida]